MSLRAQPVVVPMRTFDPYVEWLDLPRDLHPYHAYDLLAIPLFTSNPQTIEAAARRQLDLIRLRSQADRPDETRRLMGEVLAAKCLLLDPHRKPDYDRGLRARLAAAAGIEAFDSKNRNSAPILAAAATRTLTLAAPAFRRAAQPPTDAAPASSAPPAAKNWKPSLLAAAKFGAAVFVVSLLLHLLTRGSEPDGTAASSGRPFAEAAEKQAAVGGRAPRQPEKTKSALGRTAKAADVAAIGASDRQGRAVPPLERELQAENVVALAVGAAEAAGDSDQVRVPDQAVAANVPPVLQNQGAVWPVAEAERPAPPAGNPYSRPLHEGPADREAFVGDVRNLLLDGFGPAGAALSSAEPHWQSARRRQPGDPRADYAMALVRWKRLKFDEAAIQLQQAAEMRPPFWPAWQAQLWLSLVRKDVSGGMERAVEMAAVLHESSTSSQTPGVEAACAAWLGRVAGYLELPANELTSDAEAVAACDVQIQHALGPELAAFYLQGKAALRRDYDDMQRAAEAALEQLADVEAADAQQEQEQIAGQREERQDRQEQVQMTGEKWKTWIDEQLKQYDSDLSELSDDYTELAAQAEGLAASIDRLNLEIIQIERIMFNPDLGVGLGTTGRNLQDDYTSKTIARDQLRARYTVLDRRAATVRQKALEVERRRRADIARYQKATGQLIAESDTLRKWKQLLDRKETALGKVKAGSSPQARSLRRQLNAFATYVPLDPTTERQRLLDALAADLEASDGVAAVGAAAE